MQLPSNDDLLKVVSVRYVVNPELGCHGTVETDAMCQKTIERLEWLDRMRPRCVLMPDVRNKIPHAVMVRALGKKIGYIDCSQAPDVCGMLKATERGMLTTSITDVVVGKHGYFYVKRPTIGHAYQPEEIGVDWSGYEVSEPFVLPSEYFDRHAELSMVICEDLLPNLRQVGIDDLRLYFDCWLDSVLFNPSREVQTEMQQLVPILSADPREEVRQIARDIDHQRTKRGTHEVIAQMVEWWQELLQDPSVTTSFYLLCLRFQNRSHRLAGFLDQIEQLLRPMPGQLYNQVGDIRAFFSRLNYLAPPLTALNGVLSLMALRTLLCQRLGLELAPCFGSHVNEAMTVQRMADFVHQDCDFDAIFDDKEGDAAIVELLESMITYADKLDPAAIKDLLLFINRYNIDHHHRYDRQILALYDKLGIKSSSLLSVKELVLQKTVDKEAVVNVAGGVGFAASEVG